RAQRSRRTEREDAARRAGKTEVFEQPVDLLPKAQQRRRGGDLRTILGRNCSLGHLRSPLFKDPILARELEARSRTLERGYSRPRRCRIRKFTETTERWGRYPGAAREKESGMTRMWAMQLERPGTPLARVERPLPEPGPGEVRVAIAACGVCRTDLHVVDGDIRGPLPIVPGHEIVGRVDALGPGVAGLVPGQRIGVPWLGRSCGRCPYCEGDRENLCDAPLFTGFTRDGAYASHCLADARYCFPLPDAFDDLHAAPLLCAGLIGYRSYRLAGDGEVLGLYGFGAAAHILAQLAVWQGRTVCAFTRPGDAAGQAFARELGCAWAGSSLEPPPSPLDAAIIFAPVGPLVPLALKAVR